MNTNNIFEQLASNNSRLFKKDVLEKHSSDENLKESIRLALDPFTQFYIRKIPKYTCNATQPASLKFALKELSVFSTRQVTGNAAIDRLSNLLSALSEDDAKVIERIIKKDLRCGVSTATANDVWPNLIADYPCMLCSKYEQRLVDKIKFPAYVQMKMDGMRFNAIVKNGTVDFRSRNGKEIQLLGNLEEEFIALAGGQDLVFDGELLVKQDGSILDRQTGNGILNKANKGTISSEQAAMVCATIWDLIPYNDFKQGLSSVPYHDRLEKLNVMMDNNQQVHNKVGLVDRWEVDNMEEVNTLFTGLLGQGFEGIILKSRDGIWENKRAKHQIKFKGELECDLEIISIEEGTGKYVGKLGALVCSSRSENGKVLTVNVGTGFNDDMRDSLWNIRDSIIGKVVAIKYNERITNKNGEESLFLPVFIELRSDKTVADTLSDIE